MEQRTAEFYVGFTVLAALLVAGILVVLLGEWPIARAATTIYVHFPRAPRVTADTPVRKSGILIGRVRDVAFAEDDPHRPDDEGVVVAIDVFGDNKVYDDEIFVIDASLLGDATIQVLPSGEIRPPRTVLKDGAYVPDGRVKPDAFEALEELQANLPETIVAVGAAAENLGDLTREMSRVLRNNEAQITRMIDKGETTIDLMQSTLTKVDDVLGDEELRDSIRDTLGELPMVLEQARITLEGVEDGFAQFERQLENLDGITGPLGERGESIVLDVESAVRNLDGLTTDLRGFAENVRTSEGTLGQLITNPDLYQNINEAAENLEELTRQLKPIMQDLRVFSDKVSRHPGIILREAVQPRSGIK